MATCVILLSIAIYERNRANEIEARSFFVVNPEYRAIIEQDWMTFEREVALQLAIETVNENGVQESESDNGESQVSQHARTQFANLRHSKLKLAREKSRLASMRNVLINGAASSFVD